VSETVILTSRLACAALAVDSVPLTRCSAAGPWDALAQTGNQSWRPKLASKLERQRVHMTILRNGRTNPSPGARFLHLGFGGIPEAAKGHAPAAGLLSRGQQR
jgi:hypothetical protein